MLHFKTGRKKYMDTESDGWVLNHKTISLGYIFLGVPSQLFPDNIY